MSEERTAILVSAKLTVYEKSDPKPCVDGLPVLLRAPSPAPERASLKTKMGRLRSDLTAWAKAGAKLAPRHVRQARAATCDACSYWDPKGNFSLGQCTYPGCGCTRAKTALATSKCPAAKWKE